MDGSGGQRQHAPHLATWEAAHNRSSRLAPPAAHARRDPGSGVVRPRHVGASPGGESPPARAAQVQGALDMEKLIAQVQRQLRRRLIVEHERQGWHTMDDLTECGPGHQPARPGSSGRGQDSGVLSRN